MVHACTCCAVRYCRSPFCTCTYCAYGNVPRPPSPIITSARPMFVYWTYRNMGRNAMHFCTTCGLFGWQDWLGPSLTTCKMKSSPILWTMPCHLTQRKSGLQHAHIGDLLPSLRPASARLHLEQGLALIFYRPQAYTNSNRQQHTDR